jgi:hypothetical protein
MFPAVGAALGLLQPFTGGRPRRGIKFQTHMNILNKFVVTTLEIFDLPLYITGKCKIVVIGILAGPIKIVVIGILAGPIKIYTESKTTVSWNINFKLPCFMTV